MRKSEARRVVAAYVADRLGRECKVRGRRAEVARATGFTRGHVSAVIAGASGVGEDFAHEIAKFWGMADDDLERAALEWSSRSGIDLGQAHEQARRLRDRPEWRNALEAAKSFYRGIPDTYFERVGTIFDDVTQAIDAQFVGDMARILYEVAQREGQEPPRSVVERTGKSNPVKKTSKT